MDNQLLEEFKKTLYSGKRILSRGECPDRLYLKLDGFPVQSNVIVFDKDIRDRYVDRTISDTTELDGVYLMYKGHVNREMCPDHNGLMVAISREVSPDPEDPDTCYSELERFEGEWRNGILVNGKYTSHSGPYLVNPSFVKSPLYEFFINGIMFAEANPGKLELFLSITYTGGFDEHLQFHGDNGELTLEYEMNWIKKGYTDSGNLIFRGRFHHGSIVFGEYEGPYLGFSALIDKTAKYKGPFRDGLPHGNGKIEYNLGGGFHHHERIKCEYSGKFMDGFQHGDDGIEKLIDSENGVIIQLISCSYESDGYEQPLLSEVKEIRFDGDDIFGFENAVSANQVVFEGDLQNSYIIIPDDVSHLMGKGNLQVLTTDFTSKIYSNCNDEWAEGTYRYARGKVILDGVFSCLDEGTRKYSHEIWRCGFLVESSESPIIVSKSSDGTKGLHFIEEILNSGKDAMKRVLPTLLASKSFDGMLFSMSILIDLITLLLKPGIKKLSATNKSELARAVQAGINAIKGEIKENELEMSNFKEHFEYWTELHHLRGGQRLVEFMKKRDLNVLQYELKKAKKLFLRTDSSFLEILKLMKGSGRKTINTMGISVDNLVRDYEKVQLLFGELDAIKLSSSLEEIFSSEINLGNLDGSTKELSDTHIRVSEELVIPAGTKLASFNEAYMRLFSIIENALQRVNILISGA